MLWINRVICKCGVGLPVLRVFSAIPITAAVFYEPVPNQAPINVVVYFSAPWQCLPWILGKELAFCRLREVIKRVDCVYFPILTLIMLRDNEALKHNLVIVHAKVECLPSNSPKQLPFPDFYLLGRASLWRYFACYFGYFRRQACQKVVNAIKV